MASESSSSSESGIPLEELPSKEIIKEAIEKDSDEDGMEHSIAKKNVETFKPIT